MDLSDLFLSELEKLKNGTELSKTGVEQVGRKLVEKYKSNLETLAAIAGEHAKLFRRVDGCAHCNPVAVAKVLGDQRAGIPLSTTRSFG